MLGIQDNNSVRVTKTRRYQAGMKDTSPSIILPSAGPMYSYAPLSYHLGLPTLALSYKLREGNGYAAQYRERCRNIEIFGRDPQNVRKQVR